MGKAKGQRGKGMTEIANLVSRNLVGDLRGVGVRRCPYGVPCTATVKV